MQVRELRVPCSYLVASSMLVGLVLLFISKGNAQYWQPQLLGQGVMHQYMGGFLGGGISAADFDKDGYDDLLFCQNGLSPLLLKSNGNTLQPWPFEFENTGEIKQLTWVDFDNDGDRDLSMTGLNMPVQLFRNDSNVFTAISNLSGIASDTIVSYGHSWADYDLDGDLDLFVCNYDAQFMGYENYDNQLYRNDGNAWFTDVTLDAGFEPMTNYTFMALWMDYNRDLLPDLLVINDRFEVPNYFYHNNGDGTFSEISSQINLDDYLFGMTATADDFDNDGDLDVYITNGTQGNLHKINNGDGTFSDADVQLGTTLNRFCWAAQFVDADRDGLQDLHICSSPHMGLPGQNFLYQNNGEVFTENTMEAGIDSDGGWSRASALGDFNGDGLADLAVCKSHPSFSSVWRATTNDNRWLKITLEGVQSNREGVSSWIDCYAGGNRQCRYTFCGEGYLGQNSYSEFFGFGSTMVVDSLVVSWPSGIIDRWYNIPTNQQLHLVEATSNQVVISAPNGLTFCAGDSISLELGGWSETLWSTGSHDSQVTISDSMAVWVLATDSLGNQFLSDTLVILENPEPNVTIDVRPVSCSGFSDGTIDMSTDVDGIIYSLDSLGLEGSAFENLDAGLYEITWLDSFGCSGKVYAEVIEPELLNADAMVHDITCFGAEDGSVSFNVYGGTPGYFLMGEGVSTDHLGPGSYVFVWSDSRGCVTLESVTIQEPEPLSLQLSSGAEIFESGILLCSVTGGNSPYTFYLNGEYSETGFWSNLNAGVYEVLVSDSLQCEVSEAVLVETPTLNEEEKKPFVRIHPNPIRNGMLLEIETQEVVQEFLLFDMQGVLVFRNIPKTSRYTIDLSGITVGLYRLVGIDGEHSFSELIVVQD
jgi:hypothetical protein